MDNLYLFEAGATKTALVYQKDGEKREMDLPAFNPNRDKDAFIEAMAESLEIDDGARVFFYGSGLGSQSNKDLVASLFVGHEVKHLNIFDDIIGAARAAFNESPGIICIMGTGGLAAYYNGKRIEKRRGGYGYLIDDLGGGFELGRRIIRSWLNGDFSNETDQHLKDHLGLPKEQVTFEIYQNRNLKLISDVAAILPNEIEDQHLKKILHEYFNEFIELNVLPLSKEFDIDHFSIVGGVGTAYYRTIGNLAKSFELKVDQCIQSPIRRLFDFHSRF